MSIYDIDYDQCAYQLYPSNKRIQPNMINIEYSLLASVNFIQKLHAYFRTGTTESNYDPSIGYTFGQMVIFQRKVYYKNEIIDGYLAGNDPTTKYWVVVLDDFIGTSEKVYFSGGKMILEYALNRIFQTTFRQPIGVSPLNSDIYIQTNSTNQAQFYIGINDSDSSYVALNDIEAQQFVTISDLSTTTPNFTVFVPNAVLTALNSNLVKAKAIVSSVVQRYKLSGYTFEIQGY